jgi:hypothetical protein
VRSIFDFFRKRQPKATSVPPDFSSPEFLKVLSFLPVSEVYGRGLTGVAIQGTFTDPECTVEGFRVNPVFVDFMHEVIRTVGPADQDLQAAAAGQGDGYVYIIDLRTPEGPQGAVPLEDIIGSFKVENGKIVEGSYKRFEEHKILTKNGPVRLPPSFQEALVRAALERSRSTL